MATTTSLKNQLSKKEGGVPAATQNSIKGLMDSPAVKK